MNASEFERTKPTMTYQAIESAIRKYEMLLEKYEYGGKQLIMESTDSQAAACYRQFLNDLHNIKSVFLSGR